MEFEFWWLLALPIFFGMGWMAARVDIKSLLSESRALPATYFPEKDWEKAIGAAKKLEVSARRNYQKEIANYNCELAIGEHIHGRDEAADAFLGRALEANRKCVRANILRGDWLARGGKHEQ